MQTEVAHMAQEPGPTHLIDREQALSQIERCETQLKEGAAEPGFTEAQRYLKIARSFYRLGSFNKAFMFAVRARRLAKETAVEEF